MKLYVRSDLERCARLASTATRAGTDPEAAVEEAVRTVSEEAPLYYDAPTVKQMLAYACTRTLDTATDLERLLQETFDHVPHP